MASSSCVAVPTTPAEQIRQDAPVPATSAGTLVLLGDARSIDETPSGGRAPADTTLNVFHVGADHARISYPHPTRLFQLSPDASGMQVVTDGGRTRVVADRNRKPGEVTATIDRTMAASTGAA